MRNTVAPMIVVVLMAATLFHSPLIYAAAPVCTPESDSKERLRARELGIEPGIFRPGPFNAITDVAGVRVGHVTLIEEDTIRTGVTVIVPHLGNLYQYKVPAGIAVGNGFGKFAGSTQVAELGELETPVVLTNTLSVAEGMIGAVEWTLSQPGNEGVVSVNAVVGETNDNAVNDIRARRVTKQDVRRAIETAAPGAVVEGSVGAGTGTHAFMWKGGIGTSSRILPNAIGGYKVGVLVQTNFGGIFTLGGIPVGRELGQYLLQEESTRYDTDGSIIIVVATDAPLSSHNLARLAYRALLGVARSGGPMANGSGDYAIAFSTSEAVRRTPQRRSQASNMEELPNDRLTPLFQAVIESTEEAIYNAILMATTVCGRGRVLQALPLDKLRQLLQRYSPSPSTGSESSIYPAVSDQCDGLGR